MSENKLKFSLNDFDNEIILKMSEKSIKLINFNSDDKIVLGEG
jgi:hypothetical protein